MEMERVLAAMPQASLADGIVATLAAVVSNASAPDSASRALEKSRQDSLAPEQRAATDFLVSLPERFPSLGAALFAEIREDVERQVEEKHKRPGIHEAVAGLFDVAVQSGKGNTLQTHPATSRNPRNTCATFPPISSTAYPPSITNSVGNSSPAICSPIRRYSGESSRNLEIGSPT